jgi:hypothetical protein
MYETEHHIHNCNNSNKNCTCNNQYRLYIYCTYDEHCHPASQSNASTYVGCDIFTCATDHNVIFNSIPIYVSNFSRVNRMSDTYDITLIGYGIAHISLILALQRFGPLRLAIIDPYFDGGDLRRIWNTIRSNTTWGQFLDAMEPYVSKVRYEELTRQHEPDKIVELGELARLYLNVAEPYLNKVSKFNGLVRRADYQGSWSLTLADGRKVASKVISYAPGAEPKALSYPKPTLALQNVLCSTHTSVRPADRVVLFGLAHSGTLALDALHKAGATITAIYHTETPFQYARDGHYSGIKQESVIIADNVVAGAYPTVCLISHKETEAVTKAVLEADWVLYATGFAGRNAVEFYVSDVRADATLYDAATGRLLGVGAAPAFGFGIAYPNSNMVGGTLYYDVSLSAFLTHCCGVAAAVAATAASGSK